jgi:hypothetical protein
MGIFHHNLKQHRPSHLLDSNTSHKPQLNLKPMPWSFKNIKKLPKFRKEMSSSGSDSSSPSSNTELPCVTPTTRRLGRPTTDSTKGIAESKLYAVISTICYIYINTS